MGKIEWAAGVIAVPERRDDLLPRTLKSLEAAGFSDLRLFIDSERDDGRADHHTTFRYPRVGAFGNWLLALLELYIRQPTANRYLIAEDDIVMCRNVRPYLERKELTHKTYWNLFAFPQNTELVKKTQPNFKSGFHPSTQTGLSALCLVFDRDGVQTLFADREFMRWPTCLHGKVCIDGRVCEAMKRASYHEYVHHPSLVEHTGLSSSVMGHSNKYPPCISFPGEQMDAITLLAEQLV